MPAYGEPPGGKPKTRNVVSPGDWHRFRYEGSTVPGVVYRVEGDDCTIFFLHEDVPTFVTLPVGKLGTREENLTAAFREQTARNPKYLEEWVSTAGRLGKPAQRSPEPARRMPRPRKASTARKKGKPSKGQRLLFPE